MTKTFTARIAPSFEEKWAETIGETPLYEVVTQDGERIASTTSEYEAQSLAGKLNHTLRMWAELVGSDAVVS